MEDAGLLSWVNRIARIRRQERDLFGRLVSVWQVIRTSNAYRFIDPLTRLRQGAGGSDPGRKGYKSENPTGPPELNLKKEGARLNGARVMQKVALQGEPGSGDGTKLSATERAAIVARMDAGNATPADWAAWVDSLSCP